MHDALRGYRDVIDYFARTGNRAVPDTGTRQRPAVSRAQALEIARQAIEHKLARRQT